VTILGTRGLQPWSYNQSLILKFEMERCCSVSKGAHIKRGNGPSAMHQLAAPRVAFGSGSTKLKVSTTSPVVPHLLTFEKRTSFFVALGHEAKNSE
jgi:hypothetical protein